MRITEDNYSIIERASKLTMTDYNIIWKDAENIIGWIDEDELLNIIEDLTYNIGLLEEGSFTVLTIYGFNR